MLQSKVVYRATIRDLSYMRKYINYLHVVNFLLFLILRKFENTLFWKFKVKLQNRPMKYIGNIFFSVHTVFYGFQIITRTISIQVSSSTYKKNEQIIMYSLIKIIQNAPRKHSVRNCTVSLSVSSIEILYYSKVLAINFIYLSNSIFRLRSKYALPIFN
jgi:hypothetical protein